MTTAEKKAQARATRSAQDQEPVDMPLIDEQVPPPDEIPPIDQEPADMPLIDPEPGAKPGYPVDTTSPEMAERAHRSGFNVQKLRELDETTGKFRVFYRIHGKL